MDIKPVTAIKERDKQALEAYEILCTYCREQGIDCECCVFFEKDNEHGDFCKLRW